jgi:hypothetical protein
MHTASIAKIRLPGPEMLFILPNCLHDRVLSQGLSFTA